MTQDERILEYIKEHGSITPMEAWNELGITKLATRVSYMSRYGGIDFIKEFVRGKNRYGQPVCYMKYSLKD
jgi:hypothetical protein